MTIAFANATTSQYNESNVDTVGTHKQVHVDMTFAAETYPTGGIIMDGLFQVPFGITWAAHVDAVYVAADATLGLEGVQAKWDSDAQKLQLFGSGVAADPAEVPNTTSIASLEVRAIVTGN